MALLLPHRPQQDLPDALVIDGVDDAVQRHQHEPLAHRHLEADVLLEGGGHHPRAEEAHERVGRRGLLAEQVEDAQEIVHVLELLDRLPREEARGVEVGSGVEPVPALDAGDLAVEELVHHPAQERAVAARVEAGAAPVEGHLLAREQHVAHEPTPKNAAAPSPPSAHSKAHRRRMRRRVADDRRTCTIRASFQGGEE